MKLRYLALFCAAFAGVGLSGSVIWDMMFNGVVPASAYPKVATGAGITTLSVLLIWFCTGVEDLRYE